MKVKSVVLIVALAMPAKDYAQTVINQSIPIQGKKSIEMHFDYPELIRVSTWDKDEISIQGSVSINGGENDDAFTLEHTFAGDVVRIVSEIEDIKGLPHRITITDGEKKIMFKDKEELRKYQAANGRVYNQMSWGPDIDIQLEIKVPRNIETRITSVYGFVEVASFSGPLNVEATYGGVDAALVERSIGELTAETNYGEIYTNLDFKFADDDMRSGDFHTFVSAKPGSGPSYSFESKYGNVYLRKAGQ
jgi:hypothetical protein